MTTTAELREALARIDGLYPTPEQFQVIEEAARNIALPILEADPELVERLKACLINYGGSEFNEFWQGWNMTGDRWVPVEDLVLAVLAAISTPTPGAE